MSLINSESAECVFTNWLMEKENDIIIIDDIPFLADDCVSMLKGKIVEADKKLNEIIIKTTDNIQYIIKESNT